jgi:DNA-binding transcriptional LysR family regulator
VETAMALAEKGMGVTAYPELFRWCIPQPAGGAPVEFFPFRGEETTGTLAIAWMKERYRTRASLEFVAACRAAASEIKEKQYSV